MVFRSPRSLFFCALCLTQCSYGQLVSIPTANFGARPGNLQNNGTTPTLTQNTIVTVPVETGFALTPTTNFLSGTFTKNLSVPATSLSEIGFKLTNDAWPGLATFVGLGTLAIGSIATISTFTVRSFGPSGPSAWSNPATLVPGTSIPSGSEWTIECYDDNDNNPNQYDAFGTGITFTIPGTPVATPVSTITLTGTTNFGGSAGSPDNSVYVGLAPLSKNHNTGLGVRLLSGLLTSQYGASWASEARLRLTNSAVPSQPFEVQLSALNNSFITVGLPFGAFRPWLSNSPIGVSLPIGSTWRVEAIEDYDDGPGADTVGSGMSFEILPGQESVSIQTINVSSPKNMVDAFPDPNNGFHLATASLNPALANFVQFSGFYSRVAQENWASDALVAITNSAYPGRVAYLQPFPGIGNLETHSGSGILSLAGSLVGCSIAAGTQYRIEFSDSVPTVGPGEIEAIMLSASFTLFSSVPVATVNLSGTLDLGGPDSFPYPRIISYSVMIGTATITSGSVIATGASTGFNLGLPSLTGTATVVWDGLSYLRRRTPVVLTGGTQSIGHVGLVNGDIDQSGEVDATDIDAVIAAFGLVGNFIPDADGTGEVDATDIDVVIGSFGYVDD